MVFPIHFCELYCTLSQKQFIFLVMMMPVKFALQFGQFYIRVVQFANNLRTPEFMQQTDLSSRLILSKSSTVL